jgi:hypothetical protein
MYYKINNFPKSNEKEEIRRNLKKHLSRISRNLGRNTDLEFLTGFHESCLQRRPK